MSYLVRILPAAQADFDQQFERIASASYEGALRWEGAFEALIHRLADNPRLYGYANEEASLGLGLRSATFKTKHSNTYQIV